jgi:urease accessory protein
MRYQPLSCFESDPGRETEAQLAVDLAGGRTTLRRQRVGYPLHVTRGFYLDASRPDLLTLYLQSASGGLYAGDKLTLDVSVGESAAFHLTTQAATVVHDGRGIGARQRQSIRVESGAFCALGNDPYVLFPGAHLELETVAIVADDAVLFLADGFAIHDPKNFGRTFAQFSCRQRISRPDGGLLLQDIGRIDGNELRKGSAGGMAAVATILMVAPAERLPRMAVLEQAAEQFGCLAGASPAPNGAGLAMRILAPDGGTLARALEAAFHVAGRAALDVDLARRRK